MKTSLSWYNPTRDPQLKDGRGNWSKAEDLKVIRARATMKIIEDAGGFLIGTAGHNVKRIIEQTGVQSLDVDSMLLPLIHPCVTRALCRDSGQ